MLDDDVVVELPDPDGLTDIQIAHVIAHIIVSASDTTPGAATAPEAARPTHELARELMALLKLPTRPVVH